MNVISLFNTHLTDPILGPLSNVIKSTNTLCRINPLSKHFQDAESEILAVKAVWEQVQQHLKEILEQPSDATVIDRMKETMKAALNEISRNTAVFEIYNKLVDTAIDAKALDKCARKFLDDLGAVSTFCLTKTYLGLSGPTHIISYNRYSTSAARNKPRDYVVKWTNSNEICSFRLYEALTQHLIQGTQVSTFLVPKTASIDFDYKFHHTANYSSCQLEKKEAAKLQQLFYSIVGRGKSDTQIMLVETVIGSDLLDFVQTKYAKLDVSQKQDLFEKIGHVTMLDLVMGNPDRLGPHINFNEKENDYEFVPDSPANLGNLMIKWDPNTGSLLEVYAIDNTVDTLLIFNGQRRAAYKRFLQSIISNPKEIESLAALIHRSLADGLTRATRYVNQETCQSFVADLKNPEIAEKSLNYGLSTMLALLQKSLPHFWNSEDSSNVKEFVNQKHEMLLTAVSERFEIFNT